MNESTTAPLESPPTPVGRGYLWLGIFLSLVGIPLMVGQLALRITITPWYIPVITTLGVLVVLFARIQWATLPRTLMLVALTAFAAFQWFLVVEAVRLPEYTGPAQAGKTIPDFQARLASGAPFTASDLQNGIPTALVFFRGRW